MDIRHLEEQLAKARMHLEQVLKADREMREILVASEAVASAQRALAAAKGEAYAVRHDIGFLPEAAVSGPVLLQSEDAVVLTFNAMRQRHDGRREDAGTGIVELDLCSLTKFGYPNDEALPGHPLHDRGLDAYGVFEVCNSSWIKLMTEPNRVAFANSRDSTRRVVFFTFLDSTFECIARGLRASLSGKPYAEIFEEVKHRVFRHPGDA